jgi:hypothetical protein
VEEQYRNMEDERPKKQRQNDRLKKREFEIIPARRLSGDCRKVEKQSDISSFFWSVAG